MSANISGDSRHYKQAFYNMQEPLEAGALETRLNTASVVTELARRVDQFSPYPHLKCVPASPRPVCKKVMVSYLLPYGFFFSLETWVPETEGNISVTGYHRHIGTNPLLVARPSADLAALKPTLYARAVTIDARKTVHLPDKLIAKPTSVGTRCPFPRTSLPKTASRAAIPLQS